VRDLLNEEIAAHHMDAEDELLHVELGCRVTHESIQENFDWTGNPSHPERTIRSRAEVALAPICPRCKRPALGWRWQPGRNICAPDHWIHCIRDPELVRQQIAKAAR
jgi:hypothetical protein